MENKAMNAVKNMAIGLAVGAVATTVGGMYLNENKQKVKQSIRKARRTTNKIARKGEDFLDTMER